MSFDIHQYDHLAGELDEKQFEKYVNALVALFLESKEGAALLSNDPDAGHWVKVFVDCGYWYIGVLPTQIPLWSRQASNVHCLPAAVKI